MRGELLILIILILPLLLLNTIYLNHLTVIQYNRNKVEVVAYVSKQLPVVISEICDPTAGD